MQFIEGDRVHYVIGRTKSGKDIQGVKVETFIRYIGTKRDIDGIEGDRALIRRAVDDITNPNEEEEVWASRLRPVR